MRRMMMALVAVPFALVACGQPPSPPPATSGSPVPSASPSGTPEAGSAADEYCAGVDRFIASSQEAIKDPLKADTQELTAQAKELQGQAKRLAAELIDDPDGITKVQVCTQKLQDFNTGT